MYHLGPVRIFFLFATHLFSCTYTLFISTTIQLFSILRHNKLSVILQISQLRPVNDFCTHACRSFFSIIVPQFFQLYLNFLAFAFLNLVSLTQETLIWLFSIIYITSLFSPTYYLLCVHSWRFVFSLVFFHCLFFSFCIYFFFFS